MAAWALSVAEDAAWASWQGRGERHEQRHLPGHEQEKGEQDDRRRAGTIDERTVWIASDARHDSLEMMLSSRPGLAA